jgi:putative transposase
MKRSRFSEEQIIVILTEREAGAACADLCRNHGMSEGTFYNWKAKFDGMKVSDAKWLKALEDENARLKKLLAEQMLDAAAMKELLKKFQARREARGRWASAGPDGPVGTAGLPDCRGG